MTNMSKTYIYEYYFKIFIINSQNGKRVNMGPIIFGLSLSIQELTSAPNYIIWLHSCIQMCRKAAWQPSRLQLQYNYNKATSNCQQNVESNRLQPIIRWASLHICVGYHAVLYFPATMTKKVDRLAYFINPKEKLRNFCNICIEHDLM